MLVHDQPCQVLGRSAVEEFNGGACLLKNHGPDINAISYSKRKPTAPSCGSTDIPVSLPLRQDCAGQEVRFGFTVWQSHGLPRSSSDDADIHIAKDETHGGTCIGLGAYRLLFRDRCPTQHWGAAGKARRSGG